ncbi:protein translocase subunit SecD [Chlamydiota bacterium]
MIKELKWKVLIIVLVVAAAIWKAYPPQETINLGLDLQGGMHLVLEVQTQKAVEFETDRIKNDIKEVLDKRDVQYSAIDVEDNSIEIDIPDTTVRYDVTKNLKKMFKEVDVITTTGGILSATLTEKATKRIQNAAVRQALEIIRNRVDRFGVSEPSIQRQGDNRIIVQLPGIKDPDRARNLIRQTAQLEFRLVSDDVEKLKEALEGNPPPGYEVLYMTSYDKETGEQRIPFLAKKKPELTGTHLTSARPDFDQQTTLPQVLFTLDKKGARIFARVTKENLERKLAIVLDNEIQSAPVIRSVIPSGKGVIQGRFSPEEAKDIAVVLTSGALPAPVKIEYEINVGPTLGADSIRQGITAAIVGFCLVVVFMLFYYLFAGCIADFALLLNLLLIMGALAWFRATLTLPGLAGIILTIGMAVDANVLIFERIREEKETGKRIKTAIENGYKKAFLTIFDANITTLITAVILYQFGTGPVRGFAVTLSIGIIASMFTALFVTRSIFELWGTIKNLSELKMLRFFREPKIDFIKKRYYAYVLSLIVIVLGITVFVMRGEKNFGVDFTGGEILQLQFDRPVSLDRLRESLTEIGLGDVLIQDLDEGNEILFRAKFNQGEQILEHLRKDLGDITFEERRTERIGPTIGKDLRKNALFAILWALLGIVVYITFRFEFEFALGAVIAVIHDVSVTLAFFAFTGRELSLPVLAALLTIIGYSLNDTIVIFDRIREDLKLMRKDDLPVIINTSLNQTLSRTILTSLTTLMVVTCLYFFGGKVINDFAFALLIGVVVGTYSSIFVASPVILEWHRKKGLNGIKLAKKK